MGSIRTQAHKKFRSKESVGVSRDGPNFFDYPLLSSNFKFGSYIQSVHANKSPLKIWEKRERGLSRDCPNFWSTPYYLRNGQSYELQIWQLYSQGPSEQKPLKNLGEKGAWAYPGTAEIFGVPPIISGTSNLAAIFTGFIRTKALKNLAE